MLDWLLDKKARDQFVVRKEDDTEIYWNDGRRQQSEEVNHFF